MAILGFNRRLIWVIAPAVFWAMLAVATALSAGDPQARGRNPLHLGLGMQREGLRIPGRLRELREEDGRLLIVVALPPGASRELLGRDGRPLRELPQGLELQYVESTADMPRQPELHLRRGTPRPQRLPGGGMAILTERFLLRFDGKGLTLTPRPRESFGRLELPGPKRRKQREEERRLQEAEEQRRPAERLKERVDERRQQDRNTPAPEEGALHEDDGAGRPPPRGEAEPPQREGQPPPDGRKPPGGEGSPPPGERRPPQRESPAERAPRR